MERGSGESRVHTHNFRADVVRSSQYGLSLLVGVAENLRDAKVAQLDHPLLGQEDVCRLQVPAGGVARGGQGRGVEQTCVGV